MSAAALQERASSHERAARDRRTHRRLAPAELAWVREARLKYGPKVSLIDLSPGGALVQTDVPLRPGTDLVIEIVGANVESVPLRVLRSELARISDLGAIYQGACQFKRQLNLVATLRGLERPGPGWQKIVVRFREGRLLKGFSHDFHPSRSHFSLWPSTDAAPSERMHVPISQLKAVFFVRDFEGDPEFEALPTFDKTAEGRRLEVTFADDEVLLGSTLGYRTDGVGFFVKPADTRGNNLRVFVVSGAIRHVRFF